MITQTPLYFAPDHPVFSGHFPGSPIVPGVLLLDEALQAMALATDLSLDVCELRSIKFLSPLTPGVAAMILIQTPANDTIRFDILAGDRKIATGSVLVPKSA